MKPRNGIRRFSPAQRAFHLLLILLFLVQAATGLARMYIETHWGRMLAWVFGGYEPSRSIPFVALFSVHHAKQTGRFLCGKP